MHLQLTHDLTRGKLPWHPHELCGWMPTPDTYVSLRTLALTKIAAKRRLKTTEELTKMADTIHHRKSWMFGHTGSSELSI